MGLEQRDKEEIYSKLRTAIENARAQCDESTYVCYYWDVYLTDFGREEEARVIEHKLPNGLYVYTILIRNRNDVKGERISLVKPYPYYWNYCDSPITIATILSPYKIDDYSISCAIGNEDIKFMIPRDAETPILMYSDLIERNSRDNRTDLVKEQIVYYLGGRDTISDVDNDRYCALPLKMVEMEIDSIDKPYKGRIGNPEIKIRGKYLTIGEDESRYKSANVEGAKSIVDLIDATLNAAGKKQNFQIIDVMNEVRKFNEKLGIEERYPNEVEKRKLQDEKEAKIRELELLMDERNEGKDMLENLNIRIERKKEEIAIIDKKINGEAR